MGDRLEVRKWSLPGSPDEASIRQMMLDEGLRPYRWSNAPGDIYAPHRHSYHKVIYVVKGSITFGLPDLKRKVHLSAGDRLDLPAGVIHDAKVGSLGVVCLEAHAEAEI